LESSGSWGGQEYRTCLEINWLNANGHRAWLICDPTSEVLTKARELGTPVVPMSLKHRINPFVSLRIWIFCRRNRVDLIKSYSSKDHWLCLPLFLCGWPVTRARCITDPLGKKNRAFIYRHGCAKIVADAQIIKKEFIEQYGIAPEKIEVIGSAVDLTKFSPTRDPMKFRREVGLSAATANMVVIASRHTEASPIVLREAFASGRPVVATRVGDVPEIIVHGENGLSVQPNDSNALATAILLFLSDENLAARCAENGLRYAREHFCFDRMMRSKLDVDLALVEASRQRRVRVQGRAETAPLAPIAS